MNQTWSLLLPILLPVLGAAALVILPALREELPRRNFVLSVLSLTALFTLWQLFLPEAHLSLGSLAPKAEIAFAVDGVTRLFAALICFMWLMSGIFLSSWGRRHARRRLFGKLRHHVSLL